MNLVGSNANNKIFRHIMSCRRIESSNVECSVEIECGKSEMCKVSFSEDLIISQSR